MLPFPVPSKRAVWSACDGDKKGAEQLRRSEMGPRPSLHVRAGGFRAGLGQPWESTGQGRRWQRDHRGPLPAPGGFPLHSSDLTFISELTSLIINCQIYTVRTIVTPSWR